MDGSSKVTSESFLIPFTVEPVAVGEQALNAVRENFAAV